MIKFAELTTTEAVSTAEAIETLRPLPWARLLLNRIEDGGGLTTENMSALFEARFGQALHDCGITPVYEYAAGVGETSVDFACGVWNVELLSFDETDAAKAASWEEGSTFGKSLSSPAPPTADEAQLDEAERQRRSDLRKQSPEGETLKGIERIVGKAQNDGQPSKFPAPDGARRSMLVVDARTFGQIDRWDCRQIAYGADAVPEWARYRWIADDGREFPIAGAFDARNRMRGARLFRERVHFLGIVSEETYEREELQYFIRFYHNPALFASKEDALAALRTFPLFQPEKTRARRPDLFVHEAFEAQGATVQFGVVTDGRIVICRVHGDTLEDIEERGLRPGSEEMVQAFDRHKDLLRRLALEKAKRDLVERDGTIFLVPRDLSLLPVRAPRA
ncbi:blr1673 [Bradyrhizobium diazoefficiens USDA 110]|uniref:Blr1673 protein n=1 Tax=Bradyrhizobium diazoefficiens (strain JCM 10833 / BCRC 13528 / IAM 13628 / NBRC 14792 / USDA 110) TaxID=224911 RepID=Q89TV1_BRADU|nr:DUF1488 domain-containing protein [Bradyrhizobium diazoefficiens]AND87297.1 hypothetical protein AAV28_05280 [Bradyrhizobium diazoefficiens USDA 110]PDT55780.1 DUF1488 domain-containing protein [Bradyrhizobium diazoefficiens]QBP20578.1 DUF1488 domain-containing protein [Bradyrhizobium diazoefficiens]QLD46365.1 DUF1488 domain-containing protein [Bradyrhizobium diazoefficiens]WLA72826.1 DUF1488 domain-containing protein [Bradyrhizobium diazoefficiens]